MDKLKLYCFFTPSHKELYENWLKPSVREEYKLCPTAGDQGQNDKEYTYEQADRR